MMNPTASISTTVEIVPYAPQYQPDFYRLNEAWIAPHHGMEPEDIQFLTYPEEEILSKGGVLFFAKVGEAVVGSIGLFKMDEDTYEMIRLAVDEQYRGLKIGKQLVQYTLDWCKANNVKRMILESTDKPVNMAAVRMYEQMGFRHYTPDPKYLSGLARANVFMIMEPIL